MILRFLRLFSFVRTLEAALDRSTERANDRDAAYQSEFNERIRAQQKAMGFEHELAEVRAALQEENAQRLILQDRLDNVLADRSALWEMTKEAINEERSTLKMMANYRIQSVFGVTPYPEANQLPASAQADLDADKVVGRRQMPSERIAAARTKLVNSLVAEMTKLA